MITRRTGFSLFTGQRRVREVDNKTKLVQSVKYHHDKLHVTVFYFLEHFIRETNKKLYDSNDGLRSALASEAVAAKRRVSPHTRWLSVKRKLALKL